MAGWVYLLAIRFFMDHEKLSFRPISALHATISSSEYKSYACGKIPARALLLNENPNFYKVP